MKTSSTQQVVGADLLKGRSQFANVLKPIADMQMPDDMGKSSASASNPPFPKLPGNSSPPSSLTLSRAASAGRKLNQPDGIHPPAEGQAEVVKDVWKILQSMITPSTPNV